MDRLGHLLRGRAARRRLSIPAVRLIRRRGLLAATALSLAACARQPEPTASAAPITAADLAAAFGGRDRAAFVACFDSSGAAESLAERVWSNWVALGVRAGATGPLRLRAGWSAPGERATCTDEVDVILAGGRVTGLRAAAGEPAWLAEPLALFSASGAAVLAGDTVPTGVASAWLGAATAASRLVAEARLGAAAALWDGVLVVELPATPAGFARVSGLPDATAAATQAATVMASPDSAPRIVGNLAAAPADATGLRPLLVHEGVHAATRSAISRAPLWAVEGIAESVAQASDAPTRTRNLALAGRRPRPTALPTPADLAGQDAPTAYARAAIAVDAASARWGRPAALSWLADWTRAGRPSDAELTAAYLAALP